MRGPLRPKAELGLAQRHTEDRGQAMAWSQVPAISRTDGSVGLSVLSQGPLILLAGGIIIITPISEVQKPRCARTERSHHGPAWGCHPITSSPLCGIREVSGRHFKAQTRGTLR